MHYAQGHARACQTLSLATPQLALPTASVSLQDIISSACCLVLRPTTVTLLLIVLLTTHLIREKNQIAATLQDMDTVQVHCIQTTLSLSLAAGSDHSHRTCCEVGMSPSLHFLITNSITTCTLGALTYAC